MKRMSYFPQIGSTLFGIPSNKEVDFIFIYFAKVFGIIKKENGRNKFVVTHVASR